MSAARVTWNSVERYEAAEARAFSSPLLSLNSQILQWEESIGLPAPIKNLEME